MIDTLYEMLALDHKSEAWFIFGINTTKQKIRHWENKQNKRGVKNMSKVELQFYWRYFAIEEAVLP